MNTLTNKIAASSLSLVPRPGYAALTTTVVVAITATVSVMTSTAAHATTRETYVQIQNRLID